MLPLESTATPCGLVNPAPSGVPVTTAAVEPLPKPVTLGAVKAEPKLKDMELVKYSRLSVQPVTAEQWKLVCKMGGLTAR